MTKRKLVLLPEDVILYTAEAALILKKSPRTLEKWRTDKPLDEQPPFYPYGRAVVYIEREVRAWLAQQLTKAA